MRLLLLVVLVPALAFGQPRTPNLGLLLGSSQLDNNNWQILDQGRFPVGVIFPGQGPQMMCTNTVTPLAPASGQVCYCKAALGICCEDTNGNERCIGSGGANVGFAAIQSGTNTSAAMTVGTGASLNTSGTGTIAATSAPFSGLTGGTNSVPATMIVGNGSSLSAAGSGTITATAVPASGITGVLALTQGGTGINAASNAALFTGIGPLTTKGDILGTNGTTDQRWAVGSNGLCLVSDSTKTLGWDWESCAGGSSGTVTSISQGTGMSFSVNPITTTGTINLATPVAVTNGGTGNSSIAADEFFVGTGTNTVGVTSALANCNAASNFVQYSNSVHNFSCGNGIQTSFANLNGGSNTTAAMTIGTGASLTTSGTGTIAATSVPFGGITGPSTNTTAAMTVGTGGSLTFSGTGTINASQINGNPLGSTTPSGGNLLVGSGSQWVTQGITGDVSMSSGGVTTIGAARVTDADLANAYSGVGLCSNSFVSALTRNTPPTCTQVNLATSQVTGVLSHTNGGTDNSVATNNALLVGNGTSWLEQTLPTNTPGPFRYQSSVHNFFTIQDPQRADNIFDCSGTSDSTTAWANYVGSLPSTTFGGTPGVVSTLWIPSGCVLRFKSPGSNGVAAPVPANLHILCEDQTAGFGVDRQTCHGGTYNGAACNSSTECLGSGTCEDDFLNAATSPCGTGSPTTCFAPTVGQTYTLLKDQGNGNAIFIENCSLFLAQASPYQVCSGGSGGNLGDPCRQECSNAASGAAVPGERCETDADCGGAVGSCLRVSDCHGTGTGNTCGGLPTKVPSGPGNIRAIDFTRTTRAQLYNDACFDCLTSDFTVDVGPFATLYNDNWAREVTDCTSPIPGTPSNSACFGGSTGGQCCYGALTNTTISSGNQANTQPTTAVTNQVITGTDAQLARVYARGTVAGSAISVGSRSHIEMSNVWPFQTSGTNHIGPGTPGGGYAMADTSQLTKSYALDLGSSGVCMTMSGANSGVIGLKCNGTNITGVNLNGSNSHVVGLNLRGIGGANSAVNIAGNNSALSDSYLEGASTGPLVKVTANNVAVTGNVLNSNPINTQDTGVLLNAAANGGSIGVTNNTITNMKTCSITWAGAGSNGFEAIGNNSVMQVLGTPYSTTSLYATPTFHPNHVCMTASFSNNKVIGQNLFQGGTHGIMFQGAGSFGQTGIHGNRCFNTGGQCISLNGGQLAGINEVGNYVNSQGQGWTTSCDPSCSTSTCGTGGTQQCAGNPCNQDSDCGTCTATNKCIPDANFTDNGAQHFSAFGNLIFQSTGTPSQCTVAPIGQIADATGAGGVCANGTCGVIQTGGPNICNGSGSDAGKRCCTSAGSSIRTFEPMIRLDDVGTGVSMQDAIIIGNQIFNMTSNSVGIDATNPPGVTGTGTIIGSKISNNIFDIINASQTSVDGIRLPTAFTSYDLSLTNNDFKGLMRGTGYTMSANGIVNYQGSMGSITLENGKIAVSNGTTLGTGTTANYFPFEGTAAAVAVASEATVQTFVANGAMTVWKMTCTVSAASGASTSRKFTLRVNAVDSAMNCTIPASGTTCTTTVGVASAPIAITAGQLPDWEQIGTGTLTAANATCVAYASNDTVM